ncbi:MAG: FG-GAP repeat protein [Pseudomonadota bacterium]
MPAAASALDRFGAPTPVLNPTPGPGESFGRAVALEADTLVVGSCRDDLGSANAGAVYIFKASTGELEHTLTNPTPAGFDSFGCAVDISNKTVVVGAADDDGDGDAAGIAYFFSAASGELLHTLRNPARNSTSPAGNRFGAAVAIDGDLAVIGAPNDDTGAGSSGQAHVFNVDTGTLEETLPNPSPAENDRFGSAVAMRGDTALIGTPGDAVVSEPFTEPGAGSVSVYSARSGNLLQVINNPSADTSDSFGDAVAIGDNHLVVGAPRDNTGDLDSGAVYLFDRTSFEFKLTLLNPVPSAAAGFGASVALSDEILAVAAPSDIDLIVDSGTVYLFSLLDGQLFQTLKSPTPAPVSAFSNVFGADLAISDNALVVGDSVDDQGASDTGAVYVFTQPKLDIATLWLLLRPSPEDPADED